MQLLHALWLGLTDDVAFQLTGPIDGARQAVGKQREHDADAREQKYRRHGQPDDFAHTLDRRQIAAPNHHCGAPSRTNESTYRARPVSDPPDAPDTYFHFV